MMSITIKAQDPVSCAPHDTCMAPVVEDPKSEKKMEACSLSRTPAELKPETEKHNTADTGENKKMFVTLS